MPPTLRSTSYRRKRELVPKPKQQRTAKKPTRNWLELPSDLMVNILQRVGVVDILENAQKVCTAWRDICKDPVLWRVVYMDRFSVPKHGFIWKEMCKHVVDRSQGQLVDLTVIGFCDDELLEYVADRSKQLRRLEVVYYVCNLFNGGIWNKPFMKLSSLEELSLVRTLISKDNIETVGRYCPLLKTLKVNQETFKVWKVRDNKTIIGDQRTIPNEETIRNETALAIGENLPELTHLELTGNSMQNTGLQAILDGCVRLESLDLRGCLHVDLQAGDLGKICSQQIKHIRLPDESLEGWPYVDDEKNMNNQMMVSIAMFG